jgi:hypothetical protein
MSEDRPCLKGHISFAKRVLMVSVALLLGTTVASIFALDIYGTICICTVNYLSYAWIAWAIAVLFSIVAQITATTAMASGCCKKMLLPNLLLWLEGLALLAGVILMVVFIARLTSVI